MKFYMSEALKQLINKYYCPYQPALLREVRNKAKNQLHWWSRLVAQLQQASPDYLIRNFSNLDNDWCFISETLMHKGERSFLDDDKELLQHLGGKKRSFIMFVSLLGPYYYYYVSEMSYEIVDDQFKFEYYHPTELESEEVIIPYRRIMESEGYTFLQSELVGTTVPAVETECLEKGKVTLFNCLFSEIMSPH